MNRINKYSLVGVLIALLTLGCTGDFEEMNTNPNSPVTVPTAYLFTNGIRGAVGQQFYFTTQLYAQQLSETQYTNTSRYETEDASFDGFYSGPLADFQNIINLNTDDATKGSVLASGSNDNQIAAARIMKAYLFQIMTDLWGDIPYSEALKGNSNFTPAYDTQEDIYTDLVKELTEASAQIKTTEPGIVGDPIYDGDMGKWKKFANALLMRVGIRMSEANATLAASAISTAISNGTFTSNADNALYAFLEENNNSNSIFYHYNVDRRTDYAISLPLVTYMEGNNDPRLFIYGEPTDNSVIAGNPAIVGMPYGESEAVSGSITNASISFPGELWKDYAAEKQILISYSEVKFIMAEAAQRAYAGVGGTASSHYNEAITATMQYYGVAAADITAYLAEPGVVYNPVAYKRSIGEQKWVSLYAQGHEAWSEWRRLGFPTLLPAPAAVSGRGIPLRRTYAQREFQLNEENYTAAVERQGATAGELHMDDPVWWDK